MHYTVAGGADGRWRVTLEDGTAFDVVAPDVRRDDLDRRVLAFMAARLAERVARLEQAADRDAAQVRLLDRLIRLEQRVAALERR